MGISTVMHTAKSGMDAAKAGIATSGHNISNATTEGFSRQRVQTTAIAPKDVPGARGQTGQGVRISAIDRVNDEYVEKQLRNSGRDLANCEEKDLVLKQAEDIFNEMNGDGLNRLVARFFNEFRRLANEPDNEAVRQSVREASQSLVNDFKRIRTEANEIRGHIDSRLEGTVSEINAMAKEIQDLNLKIRTTEVTGVSANELRDRRDLAMKKLGTMVDVSMHKDNHGDYMVDIPNVGPLVAGPSVQQFSLYRTPSDDQGKVENSYDVGSQEGARSTLTHQFKGGKIGALLEVRDQTLSTIVNRLDELAFTLTNEVNTIHRQGFTRNNQQGIDFFKQLDSKDRASEFMGLSDAITHSVNNIASAAQPDSPGDNRVAIAISGIQSLRIMNGGKATMDDYYNSIVSDIGVASARNKSTLNQQKDIQNQLIKMREQVSGVSIDEETTNLLQYQRIFDASAKVIQIADDMMKTVLDLKR